MDVWPCAVLLSNFCKQIWLRPCKKKKTTTTMYKIIFDTVNEKEYGSELSDNFYVMIYIYASYLQRPSPVRRCERTRASNFLIHSVLTIIR